MPRVVSPGQMGDAAVHGLLITLCMFGQFLVPFAFLLGAILSAIHSAKERKLYEGVKERSDIGALNEMTWEEFESLVGEHFRRNGFQVSREGGNGPDGGIDLVLRRGGEKLLVQCKQWKAYKVGVQPRGRGTEPVPSVPKGQSADSPCRASPLCPKCGAEMKKRTVRQGVNVGKEFWGCSTFPKCNGTRLLEEGGAPEPAPAVQAIENRATPEVKKCPHCRTLLVLKKFHSGPREGQEFYGCVPCRKGWPVG